MSLRKECEELPILGDVFRNLSLDGSVRARETVVSSMSTHTAFGDIIGKTMQVQGRWLQIHRECIPLLIFVGVAHAIIDMRSTENPYLAIPVICAGRRILSYKKKIKKIPFFIECLRAYEYLPRSGPRLHHYRRAENC